MKKLFNSINPFNVQGDSVITMSVDLRLILSKAPELAEALGVAKIFNNWIITQNNAVTMTANATERVKVFLTPFASILSNHYFLPELPGLDSVILDVNFLDSFILYLDNKRSFFGVASESFNFFLISL